MLMSQGSDCFPKWRESIVAICQHPHDPHLFCLVTSANNVLLMGFNHGSSTRSRKIHETVVYYGRAALDQYRSQRICKVAFVPRGGQVITAVTSIDQKNFMHVNLLKWNSGKFEGAESLCSFAHPLNFGAVRKFCENSTSSNRRKRKFSALPPSGASSSDTAACAVTAVSVTNSGELMAIGGAGFLLVYEIGASGAKKIFPPAKIDYLRGACVTNICAVPLKSEKEGEKNSSVNNKEASFMISTDADGLLLVRFQSSISSSKSDANKSRSWAADTDADGDPKVLSLGVCAGVEAMNVIGRADQELSIGAFTSPESCSDSSADEPVVVTTHFVNIDVDEVVDKENLPSTATSSGQKPRATEFCFWTSNPRTARGRGICRGEDSYAVLGERWQSVACVGSHGTRYRFMIIDFLF